MPLIDGGTVRLVKCIGTGRAMEMILTGEPISAATAHQWGLVNVLAERGTGENLIRLVEVNALHWVAFGRAMRMARTLSRLPQQCLRADRLSMLNAAYDAKSEQDALYYELMNGVPVVVQESVAGKRCETINWKGEIMCRCTKVCHRWHWPPRIVCHSQKARGEAVRQSFRAAILTLRFYWAAKLQLQMTGQNHTSDGVQMLK